jgi:HPt (histidine-containing phosphotransfer) domain-containing protein
MDFDDLASRLEMDREDFLELAGLFVTTTQGDMDKIRQAMSGLNPADAASAAHSIKGAAGNLGFEKMADLAQTMEFQGKDGNLDGFDAHMEDMEKMLQGLQVLL